MSDNIQCPSCGGPVQNPEGKDKISCCYCGQSFVAEEVNEGTSKIKPKNEKMYNYLIMADTAKSGGDNKEALLYYNKVLEEDPTYSAAWYGKGISVAYTGTVGKPKISEATAAFKNAVKNAKDKKATKKTVAITLANTVHITHDSIRDHAEEFGDFLKPEPVIEYMYKFASYAEALSYAFELHPTEEIADLVIDEIYKFSTTQYLVKGENVEKMCNDWAKKCIDFKKKADKEYEAPEWGKIEDDGEGSCFVATATMGSYGHPTVLQLRLFRDEYLIKRRWGRSFTKLYYKLGPYPANVISKSQILKKLSYLLIVKPLAIIASKITKVNN